MARSSPQREPWECYGHGCDLMDGSGSPGGRVVGGFEGGKTGKWGDQLEG